MHPDKLKELHEKAMGGTWKVVKSFWPGQGEYFNVVHDQGNSLSSNILDHLVAGCGPNGDSNAEFISLAHTTTPLLLELWNKIRFEHHHCVISSCDMCKTLRKLEEL